MPEHVHLLVEGLQELSDLRRFVRDAKQRSGFEYARRSGRPLWQDGYYDHVLRDDESTLVVVRYILGNPVRAGLAKDIDKYPYSGSEVYTMEELITARNAQG
jgi:REP element-mobilizing transposase RayT